MTPLQTKNKYGKAMGSSCNINKGIQLIIDVIDSEMLKEKKLWLVYYPHILWDYIISQCDYKAFCAVIST